MGRLDSMLLWGHSLQDYKQMFDLSEADLKKSILDYGAGPASFNAELSSQEGNVVSCDELYQQECEAIRTLFEKEFSQMRQYVENHQEKFAWDVIADPKSLETNRRQSTELFLKDFAVGKNQGRYSRGCVSGVEIL